MKFEIIGVINSKGTFDRVPANTNGNLPFGFCHLLVGRS
jgi:hypothetical protein